MSLTISDSTTLEDIKEYLENNIFTEEIVQFLLRKGNKEDLDNIRDKNGTKALMYASYDSNDNSSENTVKMLIEAGVDLNLQNKDGDSALMIASGFSNDTSSENTVKMLIDAGADLNIQNEYGDTALIIVSGFSNYTSSENTVKMLIDAGADLNIQNKDGNTALMYASKISNTYSSENTVKMLIDAGADLNIQNKDGWTALSVASNNSNKSSTENTVKMLIDAGADLNIKNNDGKTAYDILKERNPSSQLLNLLNPSLQENPLTSQRIRVNITKTVIFEDPIMMTEEEIDIGKYIEDSVDNIVIVYNKNSYFFTARDTIMRQKEDATIFPCKKPDTMRPENIVRTKPLYDLKKIGLVAGFPCVMKDFFEYPKNQIFALINTNEKYPSFVSENVLDRQGGHVSGLHCQAGQESKISYMIPAVPSTQDNPETIQMGGVRTLKDIRKFEKKEITRKTRKRRNMKKSKKSKKQRRRKTIKKRSGRNRKNVR